MALLRIKQTDPTMAQLTPEQSQIVAKLAFKVVELGLEAKFVPPVTSGPIISVYRLLPQGRTTVAKLENLADDFAVLLSAESVLVKRMPGESAVGVFVPNATRTPVDWKDTLAFLTKPEHKEFVPLNFGITSLGAPFIDDLTSLPHLLVAGTTGGGKSTWLKAMLATLVYGLTSKQVQFVLSDTKQVEFGIFDKAPHLIKRATSVYETLEQMEILIEEMEDRLKVVAKAHKSNIREYNEVMEKGGGDILPYLIFVIDELASLMEYKGSKRGEASLAADKLSTLVQLGRAAGVHVIASTQRPSVDKVAGSIKANFPARLTFRLPSEADSRTVLGTAGAEHLLMQGDMLYVSPNKAGLLRLHAPFAKIEDIKAAITYRSQQPQI